MALNLINYPYSRGYICRKFFYKILIFYFIICFPEIPFARSEVKLIFNEMQLCLEGKKTIRECKGLILLTEDLQIREYERGNFKCQTSLLGVQTELIKKIYFPQTNMGSSQFTIKNVIKNC